MSSADAGINVDDMSLAGLMTYTQTLVLNLKTELVGIAYDEHASPFMREQILLCLQRAGLFNGDVQAEVGKHPNYTSAFVSVEYDPYAPEN